MAQTINIQVKEKEELRILGIIANGSMAHFSKMGYVSEWIHVIEGDTKISSFKNLDSMQVWNLHM